MPCMLSVAGQWPLLQMAGGCEMDQFCKHHKLLEAGGDVDGVDRWTWEEGDLHGHEARLFPLKKWQFSQHLIW